MYNSFAGKNVFAWKEPGIGRNLTYFIGTGILCFTILFIIEYRLLNELIHKLIGRISRLRNPPQPTADRLLDADVFAEKQTINAMSNEEIANENLILRNLSKSYGHILAVNETSISVKE